MSKYNNFSIEEMPHYLLNSKNLKERKYAVYTTSPNTPINYGELNSTLNKLDGIKIGEFSLRIPKTSHELYLGGTILRNCVSVRAGHMTQSLNEDPLGHVAKMEYLDIHVIKNGKLIGCLAAEKIFAKKIQNSCGYGLFINLNNGGNQEMDNLLIPAINKLLKLKLKATKVPADKPLIF